MSRIIYMLLSSLPFFACSFWTLTLLGQYRQAHLSKRILSGFMLVASALYFAHFCVFNHQYSFIPITDTIYTFATLSVYPIYYLYLVALTSKLRWRNCWILAPAIIIGTVIGICYLWLPEQSLADFLQTCHYEKGSFIFHPAAQLSKWAHLIMKPLIVFQVLYTLIKGFRLLSNFRQQVEHYFSNTEHRDLSETKHLLVLLIITSCLSITADLLGRAFFVNAQNWIALSPMILFALMLYGIGYVGNMQQFTVSDLETEKLAVQNAIEFNTSEEETEDVSKQVSAERSSLKAKMDQIMNERQLFLHTDLKLSDLSTLLRTNRTYIYEALQNDETSNLSFTDYVNNFRIHFSVKLIEKGETDIKTLMFSSGFASKATFYKNFKRLTGKTPKQYIDDKERPQ